MSITSRMLAIRRHNPFKTCPVTEMDFAIADLLTSRLVTRYRECLRRFYECSGNIFSGGPRTLDGNSRESFLSAFANILVKVKKAFRKITETIGGNYE